MTKQEAKELSLEVWRYLAEHPEIENEEDLPEELFAKIDGMSCNCPISETVLCLNCPLVSCSNENTMYGIWYHAKNFSTRRAAAQKIVAAIEAWEAEEAQDV